MITFPNCKINLGLNILRKREDGFHDLSTVFYPISLFDALEIIPNHEVSSNTEFNCTGLDINLTDAVNLCVKAFQLVKQDYPALPSVRIHLHKSIPIGAGLGGGSADAAFMLKMLKDKFSLPISDKQLQEYAALLGSDCAFFLRNKPCLATGRGEILEDIDINLTNYKIVVVNPGIHINTATAFSQVNPSVPLMGIREIVTLHIGQWKDLLINDFEGPVFSRFPQIKEVKEQLYGQGAIYAAMSGSGSSLFGIFESKQPTPVFTGRDYFIKSFG